MERDQFLTWWKGSGFALFAAYLDGLWVRAVARNHVDWHAGRPVDLEPLIAEAGLSVGNDPAGVHVFRVDRLGSGPHKYRAGTLVTDAASLSDPEVVKLRNAIDAQRESEPESYAWPFDDCDPRGRWDRLGDTNSL
jgi:hypothetical protein